MGGTAVADLLNSSKFPSNPDDRRTLTSFASPDGYGENYGVMVRGYVVASQSGEYRFYLRSDDASALWLNTTGEAPPDPETETAIAVETDCCEAFLDPGVPNDDGSTYATSEPVTLTAGTKYGVTAIMKEAGGGDYVQVAWKLESDSTAPASLTPIPGSALGTYVAPVSSQPEIESIALQGASVVITYATGTLESAAEVTGPYTEVAGATSPYSAAPSDSQRFYRLRQ
jgi:hypothetical protein